MPVVASENNHATPAGSYDIIMLDSASVVDTKRFIIGSSLLYGEHKLVGGSAGWMGANLSAMYTGDLSPAAVLTATGITGVNAIRVVGSTVENNYPVDFTINIMLGGATVFTKTVTGNTSPEYLLKLPRRYEADSYSITITKIKRSFSPPVLLKFSTPNYLYRQITLSPKLRDASLLYTQKDLAIAGKAVAKLVEKQSAVTVNIKTAAKLVAALHETAMPTNIHTVMRSPFRRVYGKMAITYSNPLVDDSVVFGCSSQGYNSRLEDVSNAKRNYDLNYFTLYDNKLDGTFKLMGSADIGWFSSTLSDSTGSFATPEFVSFSFMPRLMTSLTIVGDTVKQNYPVDFVVTVRSNGVDTTHNIVGNTKAEYTLPGGSLADVEYVKVSISKISRPGFPAAITEIPITSTQHYSEEDLMSFDLLEELTYEDDIQALGGVSANELSAVLNNTNKDFYFNNEKSLVAKQLKKNRKVVAWLGAEVVPGSIEWYKLGVFWTYNWEVPVGSLTARLVAFDTLGLLNTLPYENHQVYSNKSIGYMAEAILNDAKLKLPSLAFSVDQSLYDVTIPKAWFFAGSYMLALNRLAGCYPMHVYCDRDGGIRVAAHAGAYLHPYDTWKDADTIIGKSYPTLYTTAPNVLNVSISSVTSASSEVLRYTNSFVVNGPMSEPYLFMGPVENVSSVAVDCDAGVTYTYTAYSWGLRVNFDGSGTVRSIVASGTSLTLAVNAVHTKTNATSVQLDGPIRRDIVHDFIQTPEHAALVANAVMQAALTDKYCVEVDYRGDIAIALNDPVVIKDGIATTDHYRVRRQELFFNGALSGKALLNT